MVESIANDSATKKDEAKVSTFLKNIPEVIPLVNVTNVKEVDKLIDNISTLKNEEKVQSFLKTVEVVQNST